MVMVIKRLMVFMTLPIIYTEISIKKGIIF